MTSTQLVYAYPVFLSFEDGNQNEVFITFQEPNFFNNPWSSLGLKISASIIWLIGLCGSGFICTFVFYETQGYAASFRTVINQLVTWCYFYVSLKNVPDCIPYYIGWLDNDWPIFRPQWTLTFWVNETFLDNYQHNPMSNDLTKTKPRLFYKLNIRVT